MAIECYYFGCLRDVGHYFWRPDGSSTYGMAVEKLVGSDIWPKIDGGFCPGVTKDERGREKKTRPEVQGEAALHRVGDWTIVSFWDRSVDKRSASNSSFIVRGKHGFDKVMEVARLAFPQVLERMKFEIKLVEGQGVM